MTTLGARNAISLFGAIVLASTILNASVSSTLANDDPPGARIETDLPDVPYRNDDMRPDGNFMFHPEDLVHPVFFSRCWPPGGATILDFDTDPINSTPTGPGIDAINGVVRTPGFGSVTPDNAVFPSSDTLIEFDEPQRHVGLYVGASTLSVGQLDLVAYDADGDEISRDRINEVDRPINTCMAVRSYPEPKIVRVAIEHSGPHRPFFDRLFYSAREDLDATPRPAIGTVEFISPTDRETISAARAHVVTGLIRIPAGMTLDNVIVSVPRWDRSTTVTHFTNFVRLRTDGADDVYWFAKDRIHIPSGTSWIGVTGEGPGVRATAGIEILGTGAPAFTESDLSGQVDIQPVTIEVTQAVRGEVDLIAPGSAINERSDNILVREKPTVARGFARLAFPLTTPGSAPRMRVNAQLIGTRDGESLPGSPISPYGPDTIMVAPHATPADAYHRSKQQTDLSWNFRLPRSWTAQGDIDLALVVNTRAIPRAVTEAPGADGPLNTITLRNVRFRAQQHPSVRIWSVDYWWRCPYRGPRGLSDRGPESVCHRNVGLPKRMQPTDAEIMRSVRSWWNMSPFPGDWPSSFQIFDYTFADAGNPPPPHLEAGSTFDQFLLGSAFRCNFVANNDYSRFNALVSSFVLGCANGIPSVFRATATRDGTVLMHEAGHTMGMRHTAGHGAKYSLAGWPGHHGEISRTLEDSSAFNVGAMQALPYFLWQRAGESSIRHDSMAYGKTTEEAHARWPSVAIWHHMEDVVGSNLVRVDNRIDDRYHLGQPVGEKKDKDESSLVIGTITPNGVSLRPTFYRRGVHYTDGDLQAVIFDANGKAVSKAYTQSLIAWDTEKDDQLSFSVPIHMPPGAHMFALYKDNQELYRTDVKPGPKSNWLKAPRKFPANKDVEIVWGVKGGEAEQYLLEASRDGLEWHTLATTKATKTTLNSAHLPLEGKGWSLRVQASNGLSTIASKPTSVEFPIKPLKPIIVNPIDGDVLTNNNTIDLRASLPEFAQGDPADLEWVHEGTVIAQGLTGHTYIKKPGYKTIKLVNAKTKFETEVSFTIVDDFDFDGMDDNWEKLFDLDPKDPSDSQIDFDKDGLVTWEEYQAKTHPRAADTDKDGYSDGDERAAGSDPTDAKSTPETMKYGDENENTEREDGREDGREELEKQLPVNPDDVLDQLEEQAKKLKQR